MERFREEQSRLLSEPNDLLALEKAQDQLATLQENLTKANIDTVEDLPFSKFFVILIPLYNSSYRSEYHSHITRPLENSLDQCS